MLNVSARTLSIVVSVLVIVLLYWQVDLNQVSHTLLHSNPIWLSLGLLLVIPTTLLSAFRLTFLSIDSNKINYSSALKLTLAASVMNLVLPSKMGDVAKSAFIVKDKGVAYSKAVPLVIFEKANDFLALLLWCIVGLVFLQSDQGMYMVLLALSLFLFTIMTLTMTSGKFSNWVFRLLLLILPKRLATKADSFQQGWHDVSGIVKRDMGKFLSLSLMSVFLWFLHLLQIWLFIMALTSDVGFMISLAITPIVIFAGLMPLTFSGVGIRDLAFVYFYATYFSAEIGVALGILTTLRYILPAIVGIPFFSHYAKAFK